MSIDREIINKARKYFDMFFPADTRRRLFARSLYRTLRGTAHEEVPPKKYEHDLNKPVKLPLVFPQEAEPAVSIIVSAANQWKYTISCLSTILKNSREVPYELIVVDDNSTDETRTLKNNAKNINIIRNAERLGLSKNYYQAAKLARGQFVLFLSNTVNPQENWLASLIKLFENDESIGMVGSKLINIDGSLREAGGIVWQDGNACQYGRGDDPQNPEYCYVKEVDFVSCDSVLIRRRLWQDIGGFDRRYTHGTYEEIDLAFEVRKRGYKVVFQPKSEVLELTDYSRKEVNQNLLENQEKDRKFFKEKWDPILSRDHYINSSDIFKARDRSGGKKTLLLVDYVIPLYDQFAGSRTIFQYLKMYKDMNFNVKFIGENPYPHQPYTDEVLQYGIEVLYGDYSLEKFEAWVKENGKYIDYTYLHKPEPATKFIDLIKKYTTSKVIYNVADLHWVRLERQYVLDNNSETLVSAEIHKKMEFNIFEKSDVILTYSDYEKDILDKEFPHKKTVVEPLFIYDEKFPLGISKPDNEREFITFVGGFLHKPNTDGIIWFMNNIWPLITKAVPQAKIKIIGSNPPADILKFNTETVEVTGFVSDEQLEEYYARTRVIVAPLRFGAGVKGKVIEAVAHGIPVVTTEVGAEGFLERDRVLYVHDEEGVFASNVITLMQDNKLWSQKHASCIDYSYKYFSTQGAREIMANSVFI